MMGEENCSMTHININAAGILYETDLYLHFVNVSEKDAATSSKNCPRKRVKSKDHYGEEDILLSETLNLDY